MDFYRNRSCNLVISNYIIKSYIINKKPERTHWMLIKCDWKIIKSDYVCYILGLDFIQSERKLYNPIGNCYGFKKSSMYGPPD